MGKADQYQELIDDIAQKLASRYVRRCWYVEREELEQVARLAMVYAIDKYDPSRGRTGDIALGSYLWFVARNDVARAVMKASSPVSATHRPTEAIGTTRATLTITFEGQQIERPELSSEPDALDELLETSQRVQQIRKRLEALVGADGAVFAIKVLTGDIKPAQVAEKNKVPVSTVYAYNQRIREALRSDPQLYALWSDS